MKNILINCILIFSHSALFSQKIKQEPLTLDQIKLTQDVSLTNNIILTLSSDAYQGRAIESPFIEYTKSYIESILKNNNILPYKNNYRYSFLVKDSLYSDIIVAQINKKTDKNKTIVLLANYDNLGVILNAQNSENDTIYNGANDNATGIAALLQMALFFRKTSLKDHFVLCFTSAKKFNMYGAGWIADTLLKSNLDPSLILNFEMLGKRINNKSKVYLLNSAPSDFKSIINSTLNEEFILDVDSTENYTQHQRADHYPFCHIFKKPSYTLTTFDYANDANYLTPNDNLENIDIENTHLIINKLSFGLYYFLKNNGQLNYTIPVELKE